MIPTPLNLDNLTIYSFLEYKTDKPVSKLMCFDGNVYIAYYFTITEIDQIIAKLNKVKEFLI